jgi:hypothetical protein
MGAITQPYGTRTAYTITLNSLADQTYVASSTVDLSATDALDIVVELEITPGTVAGNKQALVYVVASLDNTNFSTGPTSGTSATDAGDLHYVGPLPLNTNSTLQRKQFSLLAALGFVPPYHKLVVRNDSGAAFAGSACAANYSAITGNAA